MVTFNWTKVELKQNEQFGQIRTVVTFNWTKVELKPYNNFTEQEGRLLLIELR